MHGTHETKTPNALIMKGLQPSFLFRSSVLVAGMLFGHVAVAQNVGIGTASPMARLHVADSNVLFTGPLNVLSNTSANPPVQGPGARLMWYPQKAAFRAGLAFGFQWDKDSMGIMSVALGNSTKAKGESAFAAGAGSSASGDRATALGEFTEASGIGALAAGTRAEAFGRNAVALGSFNTASADYAVALGTFSQASGFASFAFGQQAISSNNTSIAMGISTVASGFASIGLGQNAVASSQGAVAIGTDTRSAAFYSTAIGYKSQALSDFSVAAGYEVRARSFGSIALGQLNDTLDVVTPGFSQPTDRLFQLGNGTVSGRSNAITVLRNGQTGIGTVQPTALLHVAGSFRLQNGTEGPTKVLTSDATGTATWAELPAILYAWSANGTTLYNTFGGNVGIGTSNATQRLEVVGGPSSNATKVVIANRGGFGPAALEFVSDYGFGSQWRPGYIQSGDNGNFTGRLEFFTNGSGPTNLYGAVKAMELRNGALLTATGSVGSFSDERLKQNIAPFTDGLNVIRQINPVQFNYKANAPFASTEAQIGILAQELEKIAPYMVHQTTDGQVNDLRWVNQQAYIFLLINAIKEQQVQLQEALKKVQQLEQKMSSFTLQTR